MTVQEINEQRLAIWKEMHELFTHPQADGGLSAAQSAKFNELDARAIELTERLLNGEPQSRQASLPAGSSTALGDTIGAKILRGATEAGWHWRTHPSVNIETRAFLEPQKTVPLGTGSIGRSGYLWPALRRTPLEALGINDWAVSGRTVTGAPERSPLSAADKAVLSAPVSHVSATVRQIAVVVEDLPSAVLSYYPSCQSFFEVEVSARLSAALDTHCVAQITASTPPHAATGTGLIAQARNAVSAMRGVGMAPDVIVLNSVDAVALDLTTDSGGFVVDPRGNSTSWPLWGLATIERTTGSDAPLLLDVNRVGILYLGGVSITADPYSKLKSNLVDCRFELECFFHTRDPYGAYRISAT